MLDASSLDYEPVGKTNISKNRGLTISGGNGNDEITGTDYNDTIKGGNGNDTITNNGTVETHIFGGVGNDTIITGENSSCPRIYFSPGDGDDILYLNAKDNNLWIYDYGVIKYYWSDNDLVIPYNNGNDHVTIKNYNPDDENVLVFIFGQNLATLVPEKPTTQTMSLGASNTGINELVVNELNYKVATFTSSGNSDMQLNYTTPDTNGISVVMSEYTNTDLQNV